MLFTTALDAALWQVAGERGRLQAKVRAQTYELRDLQAQNRELRQENKRMHKRVIASQELFKARVRVAAMRDAVGSAEMTRQAIETSQAKLREALREAKENLQQAQAARKKWAR